MNVREHKKEIRFRALLSEDDAQRIELTRA